MSAGYRGGLTLLGALVVSCGAPSSSPSCDTTETSLDDRVKSGVLVAVASDFQAFHSWPAYDVTADAELAGIHDGSKVTEYLNQPPPSGSKEFPVGTIIVKEATGGTIPHELFAMVKRGGGFNTGAPGWEWFDLQLVGDCQTPKIVWRGFGPPKGDTYGGDAQSGCNTCHVDCNNDAVCAKPFALSKF